MAPGKIDHLLKSAAGEGNDLIYRFFQFVAITASAVAAFGILALVWLSSWLWCSVPCFAVVSGIALLLVGGKTVERSRTAGSRIAMVGFLMLLLGLPFTGANIAGRVAEYRHEKEIADTNALWQSGKKADAVDKYRLWLAERDESVAKSERPVVFQRVIEFDAEQGNLDEAKRLIVRARDEGTSVSLKSPKAQALVTQIQAEEEAKRNTAKQAEKALVASIQVEKEAKRNAAKQVEAGTQTQDREELAFYMATTFVEKRLRNPSTAKFCKIGEAVVVPLENNRYMVGGYVDSKNDFGRMSRAIWAVTLEDRGEQWRLEGFSWK